MRLKKSTYELIGFINALKKDVIMDVEMVPNEVAETLSLSGMKHKSNCEVPMHYFLGDAKEGERASEGPKASEMKSKIVSFKEEVLNVVPESSKSVINIGLNINDVSSEEGRKIPWESDKFYNQPAASVIFSLSEVECDVFNLQLQIANAIYSAAEKDSLKTQ